MNKYFEVMEGFKVYYVIIVGMFKGKWFYYIDILIYDNIGDLFIMLGILWFFEINNLKFVIIVIMYFFKYEWVKFGDVFVFYGGGNFGDFYGYIY